MRINLGSMNIKNIYNDKELFADVFCEFQKKGCLDSISFIFEDKLTEEEVEVLNNCIEIAKTNGCEYYYFQFSKICFSEIPINNYKGENFEISVCKELENYFKLTVTIQAKSKKQAELIAIEVLEFILDVLSVETNACFYFENAMKSRDLSFSNDDNNIFRNDLEYIDGFGIVESKLAISCEVVKLIDSVVKRGEYLKFSNKKGNLSRFLEASKSLHSANKIYRLVDSQYLRMSEATESIANPGVLELREVVPDQTLIDLRIAANLISNKESIALTLYMTSIETLSQVVADPPGPKCETCGNTNYHILGNIRTFIRCIEGEDSYVEKLYMNLYNHRSKFVHESNNYETELSRVPQVKLNYNFYDHKHAVINVKEWTSELFRKYLCTNIEDLISEK